MASLSITYRYYFNKCSSELFIVSLLSYIIFLSPFLYHIRTLISQVPFLAQLGSVIICLQNVFHWFWSKLLKPSVDTHLSSLGSFVSACLYSCHLCLTFFQGNSMHCYGCSALYGVIPINKHTKITWSYNNTFISVCKVSLKCISASWNTYCPNWMNKIVVDVIIGIRISW